jgi:hypothetical protein
VERGEIGFFPLLFLLLLLSSTVPYSYAPSSSLVLLSALGGNLVFLNEIPHR